uniref:Metadherin n=1 Tax=Callorhinchus milii TaxID=7868 RepID=V9KKV2_CALMI
MDERSSKEPNISANGNVNEEEAGDWVTKISNREKRQLRKERQKKKSDTGSCLDPSFLGHSDGRRTTSKPAGDNRGSDDQEESPGWSSPPVSVIDPAVSWNELANKTSGWQLTTGGGADADRLGWGLLDRPMATSGWGGTVKEPSSSGVDWDTMESVEQDIFANIGTWDNKTGVKCPPVTFGAFPDSSCEAITPDNTSSQESPSRGQMSASLSPPTVDEAWLGLEDPFAVDLDSDWSPPTEEWGNWTGQEILTVHELEKEKLKVSEEEEEKCQMNPSSGGKSKRKKKKKKGKQTDDAAGNEELRDDSQKKIPSEEHSVGMVLEQSEIREQQCLMEIPLTETWNTGPSTASDKSNDFILNSTKTERKKMKARRET